MVSISIDGEVVVFKREARYKVEVCDRGSDVGCAGIYRCIGRVCELIFDVHFMSVRLSCAFVCHVHLYGMCMCCAFVCHGDLYVMWMCMFCVSV